jgi:DNA sulfur modification protein DndD
LLFKELILKDFLAFKGLNRIIFPNVDESEFSLVLVLAANNAGKTNIIRALQFLLYGDLLGHDKDPYKLINDAARHGAKSNIEGWVRATLINNNELLTFQRRIHVFKYGDSFRLNSIDLEKVFHGPKGDEYSKDEGTIQRQLNWFVPEGLFDYFYFQGEELARQLMEGSANMSIASGLSMLLHVDDWESAIDNVNKVREYFSQELRNLVSANREYERALESHEVFIAKEKQCKKDLENALLEKKGAEQEYNQISNNIIEISKGGPSQALAERLQKCQINWRNISREIDNLDIQICKGVGDSRGISFLSGEFDTVSKVLKKMTEENLLPADISEGFIERLLKKQECICGRALHPIEDRGACKNIAEYRDRSLSAEVNAGLLELLNALEAGTKYGYKKRITDAVISMTNSVNRRQQCIVIQFQLEKEIQELQQQLSNPILGEIAKLVQKQRELSNKRLEMNNKVERLEREIPTLKRKIAEIDEELRKLASSSNLSQIKDLNQCQSYAKKLGELIEESLKSLKRSFHEIMQSSVKEYYDKVVTDGTKAHIDQDSLLPAILSPAGEVRKNIGGGQRQLLVLAHIISLCQLRRDLHTQLSDLGITVGKLDDQSFFLDSIFAPADDVYAKDVATFLHGKARQVLLLLASQQWHDSIRNAIEPHVDKAYRFLYHSTNPEKSEKEYIVQFKKKDIHLVKVIPDNKDNYSYSLIEEIK